jgi:SAM-dependent methyltransferase
MMKFRIAAFLWLMRLHYRPYDISYRGKTIRIFPGVFSPKYDWSGKFAVDCLPSLRGMSFLEIGAGCGIVSVFAALAGARIVVSVDISPISASNTKFNFNAHRLSNDHVILGDLLEAISHKFDFIFFNAPFYRERPGDWLERAVTDDNYDSLERFIADVKRCLAVDGRVMLGFSKTGEVLHAVRNLVVKIIRLSPAVMPILCGVLCRYEGTKRNASCAGAKRTGSCRRKAREGLQWRSRQGLRGMGGRELRRPLCLRTMPLV